MTTCTTGILGDTGKYGQIIPVSFLMLDSDGQLQKVENCLTCPPSLSVPFGVFNDSTTPGPTPIPPHQLTRSTAAISERLSSPIGGKLPREERYLLPAPWKSERGMGVKPVAICKDWM